MKPKNKSLAINSVLIVISTAILATILHELAHFLVGQYFNLKPVLHHNYVHCQINGTDLQRVLVAAAGPVFSLLLGIVITIFSIKLKKPSLAKLFTIWFGTQNLLVFIGYMLIAPIAKEGDTGKVFSYFGTPTWIIIIVSIFSFVLILFTFPKFAKQFTFYKNEERFDLQENKKQLFVYPIWISIITLTTLNLPVVIWVSLLPNICIPMTYFSIMGKYLKIDHPKTAKVIDKISIPLVVLTIASIIVFRILV